MRKTALLAIAFQAIGFSALITVSTTGTVETFNSQAGMGYNFTAGPVLLPSGVIFTAGTAGTNSGLGAVLGEGSYGLVDNGSWEPPVVFAGVDGPDNWMMFAFPSLVSAVSGFMNYCVGCGAPDAILEVLDSGLNVLESYNLATDAPISTPFATNAGAWRGVVRGTADIAYLRVINSYTVVDDLTFGGVPNPGVPEPSTAVLALGAAAVLGFLRRR